MNPLLWKRIRRNLFWIGLLIFVWLTCSGQARAGTLSEKILADQITAIYLSPQDPDYFEAIAQPEPSRWHYTAISWC